MKRGPTRKLTVEQQSELLELLKLRRRLTDKALAERFGLSPKSIHTYVRRFINNGEAPRA